jgi:16S rRNA (adenine(1408)-N(1))-methyltransferase
MRVMRGKELTEMDLPAFTDLVSRYDDITLDIGTGDGKFVYKRAQAHPRAFFIGLDSSPANLQEYSTKILRNPLKGGLANVLYVIANVEQLPHELNHTADTIFVHFPWGSLLKSIVVGDQLTLTNIARVARPGAILEILVNYNVFFDPIPLEILELPDMNIEYIDDTLVPLYAQAGITILERSYIGKDEMKELPTTWSKKLAYGRKPRTVHIRATITQGLREESPR